MKEAYFTPETLLPQAEAMLAGLPRPEERRSRPPFRPASAALLVLDLQNYFLDPASHAYLPAAPPILPGIRALQAAFQRRGRPVIFTRHANTPQDAGQMAHWWRDLLEPGSPRGQISPALDPTDGCVLQKSQYDAFYQTDLEALLRRQGVEQVVVSGVMTHLCCETTARSAFVRGFQVFFLADATATTSAAHHRAALLNLAHGFAVPVLQAEILEALDG
jgi:isochorismate hydrolase